MRNRYLFWAGICLLCTLIPFLNIARILATTGADTLSNDYLMFVQQADRFLTGEHDWLLYFQDTLYTRVHSYAFLFPIRLLLLRVSDLSINAEIYTGLLLAVARLLLFYRLLTIFLPGPPGRTWYRSPHLWLLPVLSSLVFANAQITTFSYGETILQFGLTQGFILLGLLLLLQWPRPARSLWLTALCGLLASYSGGSGLAAWPVFLLAIVWRQPRRLMAYGSWLAGLLISAWPYLAYSSFGSMHSFQNPLLQPLLIGLGLPFANHINYGLQTHPKALAIGVLGLVLAVSTLGILWKKKPSVFTIQAVPALLLMVWGLFYAAQVMLSRQMIAPWYTTSYSLFWIGLVGLLPLTGLPVRSWPGWRAAVLPGWGLAVLGVLGMLYSQSNLTYTDKSFYLHSRSPASAACLRHYMDAPTYCEGLVFQWRLGNPADVFQMGQPLARHQWSVLSAKQEWTLQGDFVLGLVRWWPDSSFGLHGWVQGEQDQPARWSDYHHLNALVLTGQSIRWQIDLPPDLRAARFASAISRAAGSFCVPGGADSVFSINLEDALGGNHLLLGPVGVCALSRWQPLDIDLSQYAGQRVTLVLANDGGAGGPAARLRFPRLTLLGVPAINEWQVQSRPLNTDLSPDLAPITASAFRLPVMASQGWQLENLLPADQKGRYVKTADSATARYTLPLDDLCLSDWSQFYLKTALPDIYRHKVIQVIFAYHLPAGGPPVKTSLSLPVLAGEDLHTYTLNLDLMEAPSSACISGVELLFSYAASSEALYWIALEEVGFLPRVDQNKSSVR